MHNLIQIQKIDDKVLRWECSEKVSKVGTECKLLCENDKILDRKAINWDSLGHLSAKSLCLGDCVLYSFRMEH